MREDNDLQDYERYRKERANRKKIKLIQNVPRLLFETNRENSESGSEPVRVRTKLFSPNFRSFA